MQAVALTGGTLFFMLFLYTTGLVKVTEKLKTGIIAAIGAVFLVKLVFFLMSMFGAGGGFLWSSSPIGIGFSVIVVGVAAFSLLLDFDFIDQGARYEAPKYMEWYGTLRPDGHADLALHRDPPALDEAPRSALMRGVDSG